MPKYILITALVASLLGGIATYAVSAATRTVETQVRINAQRLDDGRVEFALQQRNADGDWNDRLLPTRRFFPAQGFINRWATSTPITVASEIETPDLYVNNTQPTRSLSLSQYTDFCSDPATQFAATDLAAAADLAAAGISDSDAESLSWGALFSITDLVVTAWKSVTPPSALRDWHSAQLLGLTAMAQYAHLKPGDEQANLIELWIPGLIAFTQVQEAENALTPQLRAQLAAAGCINDTTADTTSSAAANTP